MKKNKAITAATALALTMLLSLSACSSNEGGSRAEGDSVGVNAEADGNEPPAEEAADGGEDGTAAEDFEYSYYDDIKGIGIYRYNGEAETVRVPAKIDGKPVVSVSFMVNETVTDIELPDTVTEIGIKAFLHCSKLKSINIPDGVVRIGQEAFSDCHSLENIEIPNSVNVIEGSVFARCKNLKNVTLPNAVKEIGGGAFWNCESLESISIPDSVEYIGNMAFSGCTGLKSLTLPDNVCLTKGYEVEENACFEGCSDLTVTYRGKEYSSENNFEELYNVLPLKILSLSE